ncbi:MAG: sel1 repeat family protein [Gammaproteobacteria bacterium]|nr:sel1 repeat family protein [Gammaproteobacteria bacterium]
MAGADGFGESIASAISAYESSDYRTARREFERMAKQGQAEAQRFLGQMYDKGLGVPQDYGEAVSWYRKAAEQKDSAAQYLLGLKYANGHGVPENHTQAYIWFAIAFNNGYEPAADPLRVLNKTLSTHERQQALQVVVQKMEHYGKQTVATDINGRLK